MKRLLITIACLTLVATAVEARQFRMATPIITPNAKPSGMPEGSKPVETITPISRSEVEPKVRDIVSKWNTSDMAATLSESFYHKDRLMDVVAAGVPTDASLRLLSIQGVQTVQQYRVPDRVNKGEKLVSLVSVTVNTQLEYRSTSGFVQIPGTNEMIIQVTRKAKR